MPDAGAGERGGEGVGHRRGTPRLVVLGDVDGIGAVGGAAQVHATLGGHTEVVGGLVRRQHHRGAQVDVHHRHQALRVREGDHAVVGRGRRQLVGRARLREPGIGVAGRHLGHGGEELAEPPPVLGDAEAEVRPPGHVPEGEGGVGLEDLVGDLGRVERRLERERLLLRVAVRPRHPLPRLLRQPHGVERLAPDHERHLGGPGEDALRGLGEQDERRGATDAGVAPVPRVGADGLGEAPRRVVVGPALAVDDVERIHRRGCDAAECGASASAHASRGSPSKRLMVPQPIRHGARGSGRRGTAGLTGSSTPDRASRRRPSDPPWRPPMRTRPARAPARSCRPRAG